MSAIQNGRQQGLLRLAARLVPVVIVLVFCGMFVFSVRDLPAVASTYPRILSVVVAALALAAGIQEVVAWSRERRTDARPDPGLTWLQRGQATSVALAVAFFVIGFRRLGFYETSTIFLSVLFVILGVRRLRVLVPLVAGIMVTLYLLLTVAFGLPLPRGLLI